MPESGIVRGASRAGGPRAAGKAAACGDDAAACDFPLVSDELHAIVTHAAAATDSILGSCEALDALIARLGQADAAVLRAAVTRIYEACCFQDITGQRIGKVVAALQVIEQRVARLAVLPAPADAPGRQRTGGRRGVGPVAGRAWLLAGPQLPGAALAQADIDALLAGFD